MRIAQLAPLVENIPPAGYGGTELVVSLLTEELVRRGHDVTLFATQRSVTEARLVSVIPDGLRQICSDARHRWSAYDLRSLLKLKEMIAEFDIIHNHMGYQALPFLESLNRPIVTTIHNPVSDYCADVFLACGRQPYVAISNSYKRLNYPERLNYCATVYNGIDIEKYQCPSVDCRSYLLFVGRVCQAKGTAVAIDIAQKLGLPIKIAGKVDAGDEEYFLSLVKPRLLDASVEFLAEVTEREKIELYCGALATVYPINFEEPFGLVMAESLAAGTPVLALNRGSVPEVVSHLETGVIAQTPDELIEKFSLVESITEQACKNRARELFSKERMGAHYESVYFQLVDSFSGVMNLGRVF